MPRPLRRSKRRPIAPSSTPICPEMVWGVRPLVSAARWMLPVRPTSQKWCSCLRLIIRILRNDLQCFSDFI